MTVLPRSICLAGADGAGKCLAKGTPVLMFDGAIKAVEDIVIGDRLMGPDSKPRHVMSLARGREQMYRVKPAKGDSYIVNESHILSLRMSYRAAGFKKDDLVNLSVRDYLAMSSYFRQNSKGWRAGVDFAAQPITLDPYFLGVWLGDGASEAARITTADPEIVRFLEEFCLNIVDLEVSEVQHSGRCATYGIVRSGPMQRDEAKRWLENPIKSALKAYGLWGNKHIPRPYLVNSREVRLKVLAGLIDTDGYLQRGCYYLTLKSERLVDDIVYLARSLGFAAYKKSVEKTCTNVASHKTGRYFHVSISGDLDEIPVLLARKKCSPRKQNKNVLRVGIEVEAVGEGDYYGFTIDGDSLFLLGDFTVTHNTTQAERLVRHLEARGVAVRVCTVWDLFDRAAEGAIPFASKRDIDAFLASLHPNGRAMFLHMAMREALDRALDDRGDAVIVLVGYWLKYNATERAYGADPALCAHLGEAFPTPALSIFLDLDPAEALARKPVLSRYESGQQGADGFVAFQDRVNVETRQLLQATGPWHVIDARPAPDAVEAAIARRVDAWLAAEALA